MITSLILGILSLSMAFSRYHPRVSGALYYTVLVIILSARVVPGKADGFDFTFTILLMLAGTLFFFSRGDARRSQDIVPATPFRNPQKNPLFTPTQRKPSFQRF